MSSKPVVLASGNRWSRALRRPNSPTSMDVSRLSGRPPRGHPLRTDTLALRTSSYSYPITQTRFAPVPRLPGFEIPSVQMDDPAADRTAREAFHPLLELRSSRQEVFPGVGPTCYTRCELGEPASAPTSPVIPGTFQQSRQPPWSPYASPVDLASVSASSPSSSEDGASTWSPSIDVGKADSRNVTFHDFQAEGRDERSRMREQSQEEVVVNQRGGTYGGHWSGSQAHQTNRSLLPGVATEGSPYNLSILPSYFTARSRRSFQSSSLSRSWSESGLGTHSPRFPTDVAGFPPGASSPPSPVLIAQVFSSSEPHASPATVHGHSSAPATPILSSMAHSANGPLTPVGEVDGLGNANADQSMADLNVGTRVSRKRRQPQYVRQNRPPRPPNAWILYRSDKFRSSRAREASGGGTTIGSPALGSAVVVSRPQADISKVISEMWKSEPPEVKLYWEQQSEIKKIEHLAEYPGTRAHFERLLISCSHLLTLRRKIIDSTPCGKISSSLLAQKLREDDSIRGRAQG